MIEHQTLTQQDIENAYDFIHGKYCPIELDSVFIGIENYVEVQLNKNLLFLQQTWEWFRKNYEKDVLDAVNYIILPWEEKSILPEEEQELVAALAIMSFLYKYYHNAKADWINMNQKQKDDLLENIVGKYL